MSRIERDYHWIARYIPNVIAIPALILVMFVAVAVLPNMYAQRVIRYLYRR